jgi:hypothetical protein
MIKTSNKTLIFGTGFLQVALVSAQTWLIANGIMAGVFVIGFMISFVWTINVTKVAFGSWSDRLLYSIGAGVGAVVGMSIAQIIAGR